MTNEQILALVRAYGEAAGIARATEDAYFATARDGSARALESAVAASRDALRAVESALASLPRS